MTSYQLHGTYRRHCATHLLNISLSMLYSFLPSALNLRIPSLSFSVDISSSFMRHLNVFSSSVNFSRSISLAVNGEVKNQDSRAANVLQLVKADIVDCVHDGTRSSMNLDASPYSYSLHRTLLHNSGNQRLQYDTKICVKHFKKSLEVEKLDTVMKLLL